MDSLSRGDGNDRFAFSNGFWHDAITDLSANNGERIDLSAVSGISGFAAPVNNHLDADIGTGIALIDDAAGNPLLLEGIAVVQIG